MKKKTPKKHKKNKRIQAIILTITLVVMLTLILLINLSNPILDVKTLNYTMNISDYVGINLDTDKLHFGTISPGGNSNRKLTINSDLEGYVFITSSNPEFIYVNNQGLKLNNNSIQIDFFADIPKNTTQQNIERTLTFYVLKNKHPWPLIFQKEKLLKIQSIKQKSTGIKLDIAK